MKVSIEVVGELIKMDYEFGQEKYHAEHKFWPDDFNLLLNTICHIRKRTSIAENKLDHIKRIVEEKQSWGDI